MSLANYHTHCDFCDGKATVWEMAEAGKSAGLAALGFSSHAPLPFPTTWAMPESKFEKYQDSIIRLKRNFSGEMEILLGLEVDFIPGMCGPGQEWIKNAGLDYAIGSVHFVDSFPSGKHWEIDGKTEEFADGLNQIFGGDIRKAVSRYFEIYRWMIQLETPDIAGHIDKIRMHNSVHPFFSEREDWYQEEIRKTLRTIRDHEVILEANTRGMYLGRTAGLFPASDALAYAAELGIPVVLNSDAHLPEEIVSGFDKAIQILEKAGIRELVYFRKGNWEPRPLRGREAIRQE